MAAQSPRTGNHRNPRTTEEARAFVHHVESLFMPWDVDALVDGFTADCRVRFGTIPEFRGHEALRTFFSTRSTKQQGYRLHKQCGRCWGCHLKRLARWDRKSTRLNSSHLGISYS